MNAELKGKYDTLSEQKVDGIEYETKEGDHKMESISVLRQDNLLFINAFPTLLKQDSAYKAIRESKNPLETTLQILQKSII